MESIHELIIPDIHLRIPSVEQILKFEGPTRTYFLGDIFDNYNDDAETNRRVALWVKARQQSHPDDVFIYGNHDTGYAYPSRWTTCSGYTESKLIAISSVLKPEDWDKFKFYHWLAPGWLLSHAGLHPALTNGHGAEKLVGYLNYENGEAVKALKDSDPHWFFQVGHSRGGRKDYGGLTWCDFNEEFVGFSGINQIFGHTNMCALITDHMGVEPGVLETRTSKNYCLDTNSLWYGLWDGKEFKMKFVPDQIPKWRQAVATT
jgi:hypothetical protein